MDISRKRLTIADVHDTPIANKNLFSVCKILKREKEIENTEQFKLSTNFWVNEFLWGCNDR